MVDKAGFFSKPSRGHQGLGFYASREWNSVTRFCGSARELKQPCIGETKRRFFVEDPRGVRLSSILECTGILPFKVKSNSVGGKSGWETSKPSDRSVFSFLVVKHIRTTRIILFHSETNMLPCHPLVRTACLGVSDGHRERIAEEELMIPLIKARRVGRVPRWAVVVD